MTDNRHSSESKYRGAARQPHKIERGKKAATPLHPRAGQGFLHPKKMSRPSSHSSSAPLAGSRVVPVGYTQHAKHSQPRKGPWRVIFWIALVVFLAALLALGAIMLSYWQGQRSYSELADQTFSAPHDPQNAPLSDFKVDWNALRAINPDVVAWIYIPGTIINYPVVHTNNDETYLKHDFKGSTGWIATFGAIFLSAANAPDFSDANNIIYGHHLNNGSMFSPLANFGSADVFNDHRSVYLLTPEANYKLTTFSILHTSADDPLAQTAFSSEQEREAYVQDKINRSSVSVSGLPSVADMKKTFALATCDNLPSNGRWVLFAYVSDSTAQVPAQASAAAAAESNTSDSQTQSTDTKGSTS